VIHGAGGVGKTTLLAAIAATRPGHTVAMTASSLGMPSAEPQVASAPPMATCQWLLGQDEPERPHPLAVATPSLRLSSSDEEEAFRRREQALFDRRAAVGGFAFLVLPAHRWFSRQPLALSAPARTIARYDVRGVSTTEDGARADLTRETKQALAYAAIGSALSDAGGDRGRRMGVLGGAMRKAVESLVSLAGFSYSGLDPGTFEPVFIGADGRHRTFDALPTRVRHLVAFAALPVRLLWAAYRGQDPRECEGVICIDDVDLHQDLATAADLVSALTSALPNVQWLLTTSSPLFAGSFDAKDVVALRRSVEPDRVELCLGDAARTH